MRAGASATTRPGGRGLQAPRGPPSALPSGGTTGTRQVQALNVAEATAWLLADLAPTRCHWVVRFSRSCSEARIGLLRWSDQRSTGIAMPVARGGVGMSFISPTRMGCRVHQHPSRSDGAHRHRRGGDRNPTRTDHAPTPGLGRPNGGVQSRPVRHNDQSQDVAPCEPHCFVQRIERGRVQHRVGGEHEVAILVGGKSSGFPSPWQTTISEP